MVKPELHLVVRVFFRIFVAYLLENMNLKESLRIALLLKESEVRVPKNIDIPKDIRMIHKVFTTKGKELFVVGGSIRDALLGKAPKDWDLATDATPDEVIRMLKPHKFITNIIETGKAFGVINAFTDNDEFEIATFRRDIMYKKDLESFLEYLKTKDITKYEIFKDNLMK
jgi:hypothetical protein